MNERIISIRKDSNLTMDEFGKRIGVTRSAISNIESGKRNITDQVVLAVCREFRVNESWLRYGTGEKYRDISMEEEIAEFLGAISSDDPDMKFKKRLITALANMDEAGWDAIEKFINSFIDEE